MVGVGSRRDVPRLERGCVSPRDAHRAVPERRRDRRAAARGRDLPARGRQRCRARNLGARLGRRGRGEGRLRDLHAQGDLRAARGRRRDDRRPRSTWNPRPRRAQHVGPGRQGATADRPSRRRDGVPRVCRGPVRDRGVGARSGRVRHRERVDLSQPRDQRARPRHRDHPVRRDARHDRGAQARARARGAHGRDHQHDGLAGDARGRLRPLHARRHRDGCRRVQDLHCAGRAALPRRAQARADSRDAAARRDRVHPRLRLQAPEQDPGSSSTATTRSTRSRSATTTRTSSSISAATSGCPSRSRARSS